MRTSEDRSGPLVTCTGSPCQSTGTSSPVSTGDLPVLPVQVANGPDRSSEVLIQPVSRIPAGFLHPDLVVGEALCRVEAEGKDEPSPLKDDHFVTFMFPAHVCLHNKHNTMLNRIKWKYSIRFVHS